MEFVAPEPADLALAADDLLNARSDLLEQFVPDGMPVSVVDRLEAIEIEHHQRAGPLGTAIAGKRVGKGHVHPPPIGETGQIIELRHPVAVSQAIAAFRDVARAAAIAEEIPFLVEGGLARQFEQQTASAYHIDGERIERVAGAHKKGERTVGPHIFLVRGDGEQIGQRATEQFVLRPAVAIENRLGQIGQPVLAVGGPEPAEPRSLECVEQRDAIDRRGTMVHQFVLGPDVIVLRSRRSHEQFAQRHADHSFVIT